LDYFGLGAQLAMLPGGMAIAVQAGHDVTIVRVMDIVDGVIQRGPAA
jgi:hypothetical protein